MIYYYTYRITCLCGSFSGYYYLGKHKTNNINDEYAGSGKKLLDYYKKYGKINGVTYIKSILKYYKNEDELHNAERNLIGDLYKRDKYCLNLCEGGLGHRGYKCSEETKKKLSELSKNRKGNPKYKLSEETKKKISEAHKGKKLSLEHKLKCSKSLKGHNSNKGQHWKKDPETGKRIYYKNI